MRRLKKLAAIALVLTLAAGAAFAQPVTKSKKADSKSEQTPSRSMTFDGTTVDAYRDIISPLVAIGHDEMDAQPIVLTRSFKEALKENTDKETIERLVK